MRPLFASKTRSISSRLRDARLLVAAALRRAAGLAEPLDGALDDGRSAAAQAAAAGVAAQGRRVDAAAGRADARSDQRPFVHCDGFGAGADRARSLETVGGRIGVRAQRRQLRRKLQHSGAARALARLRRRIDGRRRRLVLDDGLRLDAPLLDDALGLDDGRRLDRLLAHHGWRRGRRRSLALDDETSEALRYLLRLVAYSARAPAGTTLAIESTSSAPNVTRMILRKRSRSTSPVVQGSS